MNPYQICCLTYGELHNMALRAVAAFNDPEVHITCRSARYQTVPGSVAEALADKTEVFVAGSSNYDILRSSYDVPAVGLEVGYQDYLQHILEASKTAKSIGIVTYHTPLAFDFSAMEPLLGITIKKIAYTDSVDIAENIRTSGCAAIMGGGYACEVATRLGLTGILIYPGVQVIEKAFEAAKTMAIQLRREKHNMMYYAAVIGETPNGIISIDHAGLITNYNPSAERYLGVNAATAKGKQVEDLFPQLQLTKTFQQKSRVEDVVVLYRNRQLHLRKILMTEDSAVEAAVTALITDLSDFRRSEMSYLIEQRALHAKSGFVSKYRFSDIIGDSKHLSDTLEKAKIFSKTDYNVLIFGETGTGKELLAQSMCDFSNRANQNFVAINCAALPDNLLESELFGYKEGAFTGSAKGGHRGLFELASGGTIFLDEIGNVSPALQVKLLRVLQEREIMRVGDDKIIPVDIRVIAATNQKPEEMLKAGFRLDLLYRLNELELELPPLRERSGDVLLLFHAFLQQSPDGIEAEKRISDGDLALLDGYSWPGNIRELHNVCVRFSIFTKAAGKKLNTPFVLRECIGERRILLDILHRYEYEQGSKIINPAMLRELSDYLGYTKDQIAELLHISRTTLWRHENS